MDTDRLTNEEILQIAMRAAPAHVQDYVVSDAFIAFCTTIGQKYGLHVDVIDKVARELLLTLVGITQPKELPYNLQAHAGVPVEHVPSVIEEANEQIFKKLRAATLQPVQKPVEAAVPQAETTWVNVGVPQAPSQAPQPTPPPTSYAPVVPVAPFTGIPSYIPPAAPVSVNVLTPTTLVPPPPSVPAPLPPVVAKPQTADSPLESFHAQLRTMTEDMQAMKKGQLPTMHEVEITPPPVLQRGAPQPLESIATPISPTPVPSQPGPAATTPVSAVPLPQPIKPPTAALSPAPQPPGTDPYREPIE